MAVLQKWVRLFYKSGCDCITEVGVTVLQKCGSITEVGVAVLQKWVWLFYKSGCGCITGVVVETCWYMGTSKWRELH